MNFRNLLALIALSVAALPGHTDDFDRYRATTKSAAWQLALEQLCVNGQAVITRRADYAEWRKQLEERVAIEYGTLVQSWIDEGVEQAAQRYEGRKPPKAVCAYVKESKAVNKTADAGTGSVSRQVTTVYKCNVDGTTLFSDYQYKSVPCKPLMLPGQGPMPRK